MNKITVSEILNATGGKLISGNPDLEISGVACDSRKILPGFLYVPIIGEKLNGHDFIKSAFDNEATVSFVQKNQKYTADAQKCIIETDDNVLALQKLAKYYLKKFNIPVIGVTGSVGKTTTKEMICAALSSSMKVFKTPGNANSQIGVPLSVFGLDDSYEVAVFEMGVSMFGEMEKLADIVNPNIGVITNIGMSHLENFKSVENTCSEKLKILKNSDSIFYLNGDSPLLSKAKEKVQNKIVYFGINGKYPYRCEDVTSGNNKTTFTLVTQKYKESITIPCLGIHNVYNALAAIAVATELGLNLSEIKAGLQKFKNTGMRQQILNVGGVTIINDCYNASPESVKSSSSILKNIPGRRSIMVIGDMLELGENSEKIHNDLGRYVALEDIHTILSVGDRAKFLIDGALATNPNINGIYCKNNVEACENLKNIIKKGDKILIKGSRGIHMEEITLFLQNHLK